METQDQKIPKQSGHEGHSGGAHVCHKCGWPFPNPHPSPKHRRAHKKHCGTIEGYKLGNDAPDKTQLRDGTDGEHVSDNECKTPSGKIENTISRRSSSGVGSRSSRSNRSEEELFADAVTDFTDNPGPGEASDGVIQRFHSLQSVTESDSNDTNLTAENASADDICAPNIFLKDNQNQVQSEAGTLSQDYISSSTISPALASASVTDESEDKVEQKMEHSLKTSHALDMVADDSKEIVSSMEKSEIRTSFVETAEEASEDVSVLRAGSDEIEGPVSVSENAKSIGLITASSEIRKDCSEIVAAPGNFCPLNQPIEVIHSANGSTSKLSDVMQDHGSKTETNEDCVQSVPDALPPNKHPVVAVKYVDHEIGTVNTFNVAGSLNDLTEVGDSKNVCPEDHLLESADMEKKLEQDFGQISIADLSIEQKPSQLPDVESSDSDVSKLSNEVVTDLKTESLETDEVNSAEDQNVFPEGGSAAADSLEFTSTGAANTSSSVTNGTEHVLLESEVCEVTGKGLSGSSLLADCAVNDIPSQVKEPSNMCDGNYAGNGITSGDVQTHLDDNQTRSGVDDNKAVNAETTSDCELSTAGIYKPLEPERTYNHGKSDGMIDSGDLMVGCAPPVVESNVGCAKGEECIGVGDGPGVTLKIDDLLDSSSKMSGDGLEVCEDTRCSLQIIAAASDTCTKMSSEEASGVVAGDKSIKQLVAGSAVEALPDSSSQADSLELNGGSVSVMCAVSDTPPAADIPASNYSEASPAEENVSLEPKSVMESQHSERKTLDEPHIDIEKMEGISEIQTLEQHPKGSSLQTGWSSSVAHVENAPHAGKSDEKHHTPLKTLLGEATARSRAESPIHHNQPVPQKDETSVSANNGFSKTEDVIHAPEASKDEIGKEWDSPARYPVNIKTEKKRGKSRPYWAPFLCCSSVNAR